MPIKRLATAIRSLEPCVYLPHVRIPWINSIKDCGAIDQRDRTERGLPLDRNTDRIELPPCSELSRNAWQGGQSGVERLGRSTHDKLCARRVLQ